jgi:hypothetical protein
MLTKAAEWRKWIRRVPEIGGLREMAGVTAGWQKDTDQNILQSIVLWHTRDSVAHTLQVVAEEEWCHQHHYSPEIVRNLINLA